MTVFAVVRCDHPGCRHTITSHYDRVEFRRWGWIEVDGRHLCWMHASLTDGQ